MKRRKRYLVVLVVVFVGVLGAGGGAAARTGWFAPDSPTPSPMATGGGEFGVEGVEVDDSVIAADLSAAVRALPGFPASLLEVASTEITAGVERMAIASYESVDGGLVDFVVQRLSKPLPADVVDPGGRTAETMGPGGESIAVVDKGHTLQVIVVSKSGTMCNIIVERINRVEASSPSELGAITIQTLIEWATSLIASVEGEL